MRIPTPTSVVTLMGCLLILAGCFTDTPCPHYGMPASPAVWIEVTDARTGAAIGEGVTGLCVVDGKPIQLQWEDAGDGNVFVAYGPRGTYDLFLAKEGYLAWFKGGVTVTGTRCLIHSTNVQAEMVPVE